MKPKHSDSLLITWEVADWEAHQMRAEYLEPIHLLIGICKMVDLDLPALVSKDNPDRDSVLEELLREVRRIRTVFSTAHVDARVLRRRLRQLYAHSDDGIVRKGRLHRSETSKEIFSDAEHFAEISGSTVLPVHLLYALLLSKDDERDAVMSKLHFNASRLRGAVKRETLLGRDLKAVGRDHGTRQLN